MNQSVLEDHAPQARGEREFRLPCPACGQRIGVSTRHRMGEGFVSKARHRVSAHLMARHHDLGPRERSLLADRAVEGMGDATTRALK